MPVATWKRVCLDGAKLRAWLEGSQKRRKDLCAFLPMEYGTLTKRISAKHAWSKTEADRLVSFFGSDCVIDDLFVPIETNRELETPRSSSGEPKLLGTKKIKQMYSGLGAGSFVCVYSVDGFLEVSNAGLYGDVVRALEAGMEIFYLFPEAGGSTRSLEDFHIIADRMRKDVPAAFEHRVHAHYMKSDGDYLCSRVNRYVLVGTVLEDGTKHTERVLLYVYSRGDYWLEISRDDHPDFLRELEQSIDPVPYRPSSYWRTSWQLPDLVRVHYQQAFRQENGAYALVKEIADTKESARRLAEHIHLHLQGAEFHRETSVVRWLDIGSENGINTAEVLRCLSKHDYRVALTALDTSLQSKVHPVLQTAPFFNGPNWTFEHFCEVAPPGKKFDVITSLHSWYVIDPAHLLDAYRRLSDYGVLCICIGPLEPSHTCTGNFVNCVTAVIDDLLAKHKDRDVDEDTYTGKVVKADPYRNYGEDIVAACNAFFGETGVDFMLEEHCKTSDASLVISPDGLTEAGQAIVDFFTHGLDVGVEPGALYDAAYQRLTKLASGGRLPASEFDISIAKQRVMQRKRRYLQFTS